MSRERHVSFATSHGHLHGLLILPEAPRGLILIAAGGDAHGPQARLAAAFTGQPYAVLTLDFLTTQETHYPDFAHNVPLLTPRFLQVLEYLGKDGDTCDLPVGLFAVGDIAAAALRAAAQRDTAVRSLVLANALIDHAGLQYLKILSTPLEVLLTPDFAHLQIPTERAFAHVSAKQLMRIVEDHELAGEAASWLMEHLKA